MKNITNEHYVVLFRSLDTSELESLKKSNYWTSKERSNILRILRECLMLRAITDLIPLMFHKGLSYGIMSFLAKDVVSNHGRQM